MIVSTIRQFGLRLRADPEEIPFQYSANVQMKFEKDENYNDYTVVGYYIPPGENEAKLLSINDDGKFILGPDCFKQRGTLSFSFNLINSQEEVHLGSIDFEIRYAFGDSDTILPEPEEVWISLVTKVAKDAIKEDVALVKQKANEALQSASLANDKANEAQEYANNANQSANSASLSASSALTAKNSANTAKTTVEQLAGQVKTDSEEANKSAQSALKSAISASNSASQLSNVVGKVGEYVLYNGFDIEDVTPNGFWSQSNGNFTSVKTFNACNRYVEIKPNTNYYGYIVNQFDEYVPMTSQCIAVWYDEEKNYISGQFTGDTNIFTSPENAKYVRLSYQNAYNIVVFTEIENLERPSETKYSYLFAVYNDKKIEAIQENIEVINTRIEDVDNRLKNLETLGNVDYKITDDGIIFKTLADDEELELEVFNAKGGNNSFNFGWLKRNGKNYKQMGDDIAPFFCDNTYVGSNHGNSVGFKLVANNHQKTELDIGAVYSNNGTEYIILYIIDENTLMMLGKPLEQTYFGIYRFPSSALTGNELEHVSGGSNTGNIVFSEQTRQVQIVPCVKNIKKKYFSDKKNVENGTGKCGIFTITLQYEIIDLVKVYERLASNVGNNTNTSYYDSDIDSDMMYTLNFNIGDKLSVVIEGHVTLLREKANGYRYGIIQAEAFGVGGRKTYIPFSSFDAPQNLSSVSLKISDWENEEIPPYKFYQFDADMKDGWVIGYDITQEQGKPQTRKSNISNGSVSCFDLLAGTNKMYPYICNSSSAYVYGDSYGGRAFCGKVSVVDNSCVFKYDAENYTIIELEVFDPCGISNINLGDKYIGKSVQVVHSSSSIKILNNIVSGKGIKWLSIDKGSATLKIC